MTSPQDDDVRARLAALDPMPPSVPVDPVTSPRARELLERVMLTTDRTPDTTSTPRWRRPAVLAAAAAAVVAAGIAGVVVNGGDPPAATRAKTTLALKVGGSTGVSMHSCVQFSVEILKNMPVAFAGTVTGVGDADVSLAVDRWFKGGTAEVVTVSRPPGHTSIPDVEFVKGRRYLVTATHGTVNSCGFSAEATPELERSFAQAFQP